MAWWAPEPDCPGSNPSSSIRELCYPGQVTYTVCASVSSSEKGNNNKITVLIPRVIKVIETENRMGVVRGNGKEEIVVFTLCIFCLNNKRKNAFLQEFGEA